MARVPRRKARPASSLRRRVREGEDRLHDVLEAAGAGLWERDAPTGANRWSDGLWELYGLPREGQPPSYDLWLSAVHPEDRERVDAASRRAAERGEPLSIEYRLAGPRGQAGEPRWLASRGHPIRGRAGRITGYRGIVFDVTDLKRAAALEREKRHNDALLEAVEQLPIGVLVVEQATGGPPRIIASNLAYQQMVGGLPGAQADMRDLPYQAFQPDRATAVPPSELPGPRALRAGEVIRDVHLHVRRPDGGWRVISASAAPIVGALAGAARRAVVVMLDVTDRVDAQEAARAGEERLREVIQASSEGFWERDFTSGLQLVSARMNEILGNPSVETLVAGGEWRIRVAPEDHERLAHLEAQLGAGTLDRFDVEYRIERPEGSRRWVRSRGMVHTRDAAGRVLRMSGTYADIHDRKLAEDALRASEARFRDVVASAGEYVFEMDPRGVLSYLSDAVHPILGYRPEELVGRSAPELVEVPERGDALPAVLARGEPFTHLQLVARHRSGRPVWLDASAVPTRAADGSLTGYRGTAMDVTYRHEAEVEQSRLQAQLAQARKMEVVGRLAGGVAHDFNNLLTVILSCGLELRDALQAGEQADPELASDVLSAAQRAADLTGQLLAFARKTVVSPEVVDLNDVLQQARKLLRRVIGEDVRVQEELAEGLWPVLCDRGLVSQVIMNLAVNARDAMPHGGTLTFATANRTFGPGEPLPDPELAPGRYASLQVKDSGAGMAPEVLEHVFEPFFTTKEAGAGTGLGLATVYGIVRQAGGVITVRSAPGEGTAFEILLPATTPAPAAVPREPPRARGGTETLLVVEDEPKVREILARVLRSAGYTVLEAGSGAEAIDREMLTAEPIHLLVTDVVMPGLGGREAAERILARRPGLRVLYVSGYTRDAISRRGVLDEGISFLAKPFRPDDLLLRVRSLLDGR